MILIGYDGSADAKAAIDHTAVLFPGAQTAVLAVWKSFEPLSYHGGLAGAFAYSGPLGRRPEDFNFEEWDRSLEKAAHAQATEGAERATRAGLDATPRVARRRESVADAIIDEAGALDAAAIVVGSRGNTRARSWLVGSVSHAVLEHADRTVIVVPSSTVAAKRADHRRLSAAGLSPQV